MLASGCHRRQVALTAVLGQRGRAAARRQQVCQMNNTQGELLVNQRHCGRAARVTSSRGWQQGLQGRQSSY